MSLIISYWIKRTAVFGHGKEDMKMSMLAVDHGKIQVNV